MSDETTTNEELPLEDQKKAINLQDLLYIKQYIDMNHYDKDETDAMLNSKVAEEVEAEVNSKMEDYYKKTEIDENHYTKAQIDNNHYTKTEANSTFYKKTDTVANAEDAAKVNGLEIVKDENGVLKIGDVIIPQRKNILDSISTPAIVMQLDGTLTNLQILLTESLNTKDKVEFMGVLYDSLSSDVNDAWFTFEVVIPGFSYVPDTNEQQQRINADVHINGVHYHMSFVHYISQNKLLFDYIQKEASGSFVTPTGWMMTITAITKIIE